ncbi:MAG: helix-turn-helix domain-containing protein [Rubrivivax sp.]
MDLLSEVGYERLTTAQIAQRAGVSKGAQAHHYPSKDDMLVAAFQHLLLQWEERRTSYARAQGAGGSMDDLLQTMWRHVFGRPDYLASLEVMLAARHNLALRDRLREVLRGWTLVRDDTFRELVPLEDPEELATFLQINFCVLRGLAVYEGLAEDKGLPQRVLSMWSGIASAFVALRRRPAAKPAPKGPVSSARSARPRRSRP